MEKLSHETEKIINSTFFVEGLIDYVRLPYTTKSSVGSEVAWESRGTAIDLRVQHIFS